MNNKIKKSAIELLYTANQIPVVHMKAANRLELFAERILEAGEADSADREWAEELEDKERETFPGQECPIKTWLRVTMDRAPEDPKWIEYCRRNCTDRLSRMTWDFPVPIGTTPEEIRERIIEDTGYRPRFYEIIDNKGPNPALIPNGHRCAPITAKFVATAVELVEAGRKNLALKLLESI